MRFVWFWTFWHWSKESFVAGALLRSPLHGIGGHWDEWFRHEASVDDRQAIEAAGRTKREQRQFVSWLVRRWSREAEWRGSHPPARFVLAQLARVAPFDQWSTLDKYRASYGVSGVSAIVLGENSVGDASDVRVVEALVLPADADAAAPFVVGDGFDADTATLAGARRAAASVLAGRGLLFFLVLWLIGGRRPYGRWAGVMLTLGWVAAAALILQLLLGPDPGRQLPLYSTALLGLWSALVVAAIAMMAESTADAWQLGREWSRELTRSQVRLRMSGGLRLQGESAELPFCLNTLLALYRAHPADASRSWLWRRFFSKLRSEASLWAATGVIGAGGRVEPVVLEPKLRAAVRHRGIAHVLTPRQREAGRRDVERLLDAPDQLRERPSEAAAMSGSRLGLAAQRSRLRSYPCRNVAQALIAIGDFQSVRQMSTNALAVVVSVVMLAALPDVWSIVRPPRAPLVIAPSSPSPYHLWVSLDTKDAEDFTVVLESDFWANRRAEVARYRGANASTRAELALNRLGRQRTPNQDDGTVWVERRRRFLIREFMPGERVGRYSLSYVNRLGHD